MYLIDTYNIHISPSYQFKPIVFGSQFISAFTVPVYLSSVALSHGAFNVFVPIPLAHAGNVNSNKNNTPSCFINITPPFVWHYTEHIPIPQKQPPRYNIGRLEVSKQFKQKNCTAYWLFAVLQP